MKEYTLEVKPALPPKERHKIEDCLTQLGYKVSGGGTMVDMSSCDITFSKEEKYICEMCKNETDTLFRGICLNCYNEIEYAESIDKKIDIERFK